MHRISPEALLARIESGAGAQAGHLAFDCDGTLVTGHVCSHANWVLLRREREASFHDYLALLRNEVGSFEEYSPEDWRRMGQTGRAANRTYFWEVGRHRGLTAAEVREATRQAMVLGLREGSFGIVEPLATLARRHASRSWIVSGSPVPCVEAIADWLGIDRARVIASRLAETDGAFEHRFAHPGLVWEGLKADLLEEAAPGPAWLAAGDSVGDWELLRRATGWAWCLVRGSHDPRGESFSDWHRLLEAEVLGGARSLPGEPGLWLLERDGKYWVLDLRPGH